MIVFRSGAPLIVCDGCFRPKRPGETGWRVERGILDAAPARPLRNRPSDPMPAMVTQPRQDAHACPGCAMTLPREHN